MKSQLTCIIVDDDVMSLKIIKSLVDKTEFLELAGMFESALPAIQYLHQYEVDLIFLDVEMPEMTGLELIGKLIFHPQIIMVSSKEKYALDAFQYEVADYLLKPVESYARFLKAAQRARSKIEDNRTEILKSNDIYMKIDSLLVKFNMNDILWIEAFGDYVKVKTQKKLHIVYATLKSVEKKLPSDRFIRIHRSYMVQIDKIDNIDLDNLQIDNKIFPIGNSYKKQLLKRINTL